MWSGPRIGGHGRLETRGASAVTHLRAKSSKQRIRIDK